MATYGTTPVPARATGPLAGFERAAEGGQDLLLLVGRLALAAIFIQSGFGKLLNLDGFAANLTGQGVPMAYPLALAGAVVEFFGGLMLALGAWTRLAALAIAGFTVAATLIAHRYWDAPDSVRMMQTIQFMKNLAIVGGLLTVLGVGGGRFSVDGVLRRNR